jgi:DNA-binding MarR family transcriptional regulator
MGPDTAVTRPDNQASGYPFLACIGRLAARPEPTARGRTPPHLRVFAAVCNNCCMNRTGPAGGVGENEVVVDAVLTASRALVAIAARSLAGVAEEVTLTQYRSLVVLAARGPQSVMALADALAVTSPTASRLSERMVRKGLVARREDPRDRRAVILEATGEGRQLVDVVTDRRREEIARLLAAVPVDKQRSLVDALGLLAEAAGEVPEQEWSTGWDL